MPQLSQQLVDPFGPGVDSYSRMGTVLRNHAHMSRLDWFAQLGRAWTACDDVARHRHLLRAVLKGAARSELDAMMEPHELAAFAELPERLVVWRGCYPSNRAGLSWTLDREVAERHVSRSRYQQRGAFPLLRRANARKDRAILKLDRDESEVIVLNPYGIAETQILP